MSPDAYCIVNIDDALTIFRLLRKQGLKVRRRCIPIIGKNSHFNVYQGMTQIGCVMIDSFRKQPRGKITLMDAPTWTPQILEMSKARSLLVAGGA